MTVEARQLRVNQAREKELHRHTVTLIDSSIRTTLADVDRSGLMYILNQPEADRYNTISLDEIENGGIEVLNDALTDSLIMVHDESLKELYEKSGRSTLPSQKAYDRIVMLTGSKDLTQNQEIHSSYSTLVFDMEKLAGLIPGMREGFMEGMSFAVGEEPFFGVDQFKDLADSSFPLLVEMGKVVDVPRPSVQMWSKLWKWYVNLYARIEEHNYTSPTMPF